MKIVRLLTDSSSQFTDRYTSKKREPTGYHDFDVRCGELGIEHRLCPPRHPQTNGMVERFNGRIGGGEARPDLLQQLSWNRRYRENLQPADSTACAQPSFAYSSAEGMAGRKTQIVQKRVYNQPGLDGSSPTHRIQQLCNFFSVHGSALALSQPWHASYSPAGPVFLNCLFGSSHHGQFLDYT